MSSLQQLQKIGSSIPQDPTFNCDTWAKGFREELTNARIPYKEVKYLIRPGKDRNAIAPDAKITFNDEHIGHDSHFFTIVMVHLEDDGDEKVEYVFDNLHPEGTKKEGYADCFKFYLGKREHRMDDPTYEQVEKVNDVIVLTKCWAPPTDDQKEE